MVLSLCRPTSITSLRLLSMRISIKELLFRFVTSYYSHREVSTHLPMPTQTLLPCNVAANDTAKSTLLTPTPTTYVQHALTTLGVASQTSGYWPHALQVSQWHTLLTHLLLIVAILWLD